MKVIVFQTSFQISKTFDDFPFFEHSILEKIQCVPCLTAKARRAPVRASSFKDLRPLHLVHLDISDPLAPSLAGNTLTVAFLDDFTENSDVFMISSKAALPKVLEHYKARTENVLLRFGYTLQHIRLDRAGENISDIF